MRFLAGNDSSYTAPSQFQQQMEQQSAAAGVPPAGVGVPAPTTAPGVPPAPGPAHEAPAAAPAASPAGPPRPPPPAAQPSQPVPAAGSKFE